MYKGTFKSFNCDRGFGFIQNAGLGDVFCHVKNCHVAPGTYPIAGEKCQFDLEEGSRGPRAINVKITARAQPEQQPVGAGERSYIEYAVQGRWRRE
jgi:cold shock CspA family protein